ncbi:MAG: hypothetical protein NNA21_02605 [Nitrospira sp.]|nr:hypothetical protein [Nitrospira sp.]MCP9461112.1 hypothetical protein [Nitrospira sp.]MCP9473777.1 hypothetical protein [Nitrospira sp.]
MTTGHLHVRSFVAVVILAAFALSAAGCWWSREKPKVSDNGAEPAVSRAPAIALKPSLWLAPSMTGAAISYTNACGEPSVIAISDALTEIVPRKLGQAFSGLLLHEGEGQTGGEDSFIEIGLGSKRVDLVIPPQTPGTYPARVTLGVEAALLAEDGAPLFHAKLQGVGHGEVEVTGQSCEVKGLEPIVRQAVETVGDSLLKQVTGADRIREYAQQRAAALSRAPAAKAPDAAVPGMQSPHAGAVMGGGAVFNQLAPSPASPHSTALAFLAILRDESQDHMIEPGEPLTIEVEVKNEGAVEARNVEVAVGGNGSLPAHFPSAIPIGDVRPGEIKYASVTKPITDLKGEPRGELMLSVRSLTPLDPPPHPKQFTLVVKTDKSVEDTEALKIDRPPAPLSLSKQTKAVVIAIGVGAFRDEHVPHVKYAERDAEAMATYLRTIAAIPDHRVRLLVDHFALKHDIEETFDEWLPKQVDAATVVYIFFAGRALVDGSTGSVSLVPFDGSITSTRRLYPVRRMQEVLSRLPMQRAIMMFDVSLDPSPGANPATTPHADWGEGADEEKDHVMWMVGNRNLQEAHAYESAKHGLFTYSLLRGLHGLADIDRDGTVAAGELCTYARNEVIHVSRKQFGNPQRPLCSPPPGQGAVVRIHPMARGNNPKSSDAVKKTAPPEERPAPASPLLDVGPKL